VRFHLVQGRHDFLHQPFLDRRVAGKKRPQTIADDFAFGRIFPEATLALTISAISIDRVMLSDWVVRMARLLGDLDTINPSENFHRRPTRIDLPFRNPCP